MSGTDLKKPIAIIAGGGSLPSEVATALAVENRNFIVIAIRGEAGPELDPFSPFWLDWGQIGQFLDLMKKNDCQEMVLIGSITRRPDFLAVKPDLGALKRLPRIIATLVGGDDSVLKRVIGLIEREGLSIVAAQDVAPQLLAPVGAITRADADAGARSDIELGLQVIQSIGQFDIGQAVVVAGGRVVAVEGAEGTDRMLERCAEMRRAGRLSWRGLRGALIKRTKPGQELRTDLPAIGPHTVKLTVEAGLAGIAVEAGGVLIAKKQETVSAADAAGLFVAGVPIDAGKDAGKDAG